MRYCSLFFIIVLASCSSLVEPERLPQSENSIDKELGIWLEQYDTLLKERAVHLNCPIDYTELGQKEKFYPYFEIEIFPMHLENETDKK